MMDTCQLAAEKENRALACLSFLNQTVVVGGTVGVHRIIELKVPLVIFDPWRAPLDVISLIERG
jgi:hypothetical protein